MKNNKFLYYPLIILAILFLADKIFLISIVKSYIKSDFTYIYYEAKEDLFHLLKERYPSFKGKKKLMLILGSSRLLYFDAKDLTDFYPEWEIYNFSSAVTTPAYYTYYLEKILDAGIKPDFILLETDPNQFNANTPVFRDSNLTYSFDVPFMFKYISLFGKDYFSFYMGKTFFASSKNKPYLNLAYARMNDPNMNSIFAMEKTIRQFLLDNKGNAISPVNDYVEKNAAVLEATSQRTIDWLFTKFKFSDMQYSFYEIILQRILHEQIPLMIVWPQNSPPMEEKMKNLKIVKDWEKRNQELTDKYGFAITDMSRIQEFYCNSFADGSHMSKSCYHPFMRYVMSEYYNKLAK